jgi:hypothetical protein
MLLLCPFGGTNRKAKSSERSRRPRHTFRPSLEILEGRLTPAGDFTWKGAMNMDWSNAANWQRTAGDGTYPGANGGTQDTATFDNTATKDCELNETVTVHKLTLLSRSAKVF